jgi:hypothetical protein
MAVIAQSRVDEVRHILLSRGFPVIDNVVWAGSLSWAYQAGRLIATASIEVSRVQSSLVMHRVRRNA